MIPKISYLVSTYDSASYLDRHLDDLLTKQTDPDFEVIVVDSASPGADGAVTKKWMERDERVRYVLQEERTNYGVSWLEGWSRALGKYVSNSNTDDLHHPEFTARICAVMENADKSVAFCYAGLNIIDVNNQLTHRSIKPPFDFERYSYQCEGGPQLTWRNDGDFRKMMGVALDVRRRNQLMYERAAQHHSAFDYWLMLYFMSKGFHGLSIPELLTVYTQRPDSIENKCYGMASTYESLASISEFFPHHFKNRLKENKEFANFDDLPDKEEWLANRKKRK